MLNSFDAKDNSMPFELQIAVDGVKLILAGRLGVQQARPLWDALQPAMAARQSIRLQAEELDEIDTSVIQILCRVSSQTCLQIGGISDGFLAALGRRGLERFFVQSPVEPETQIPQPQPETLAKSARQGHG
jgi:ABC-type transporter Mla MlaB component